MSSRQKLIHKGRGRFIFVGGAPRSGTTLLQNILDSHPEIIGGPEFVHLPDIIAVRNKLQDSVSKDWITEFTSSERIDQLTRNYIEAFLLPLLDRHKTKYLSEKTPHNLLIFSELLELFPESHFIQIVRDPRSTISSMLQVGKHPMSRRMKNYKKTTAATNYLQRFFDAGFDAVEKAPDRVLTVFYEKLVQDPVTESKCICDFLGLDWSERMTRPGEFKHIGEKAMTIHNQWYDTKKYNRNPQTSEIDKWRRTLTPLQQVWVNLAFRDRQELTQAGYDFSLANVSYLDRWLGLALFRLSRTIRKFPPRTAKLARLAELPIDLFK